MGRAMRLHRDITVRKFTMAATSRQRARSIDETGRTGYAYRMRFGCLLLVAACGDNQAPPAGDRDVPFDGTFCTLPGSFVHDGEQTYRGAGGQNAPRLDWLTVPAGFCAHPFANVAAARQIKFAPGGELFVASPSRGTAGGAMPGSGSIVVLADDDRNGFADF